MATHARTRVRGILIAGNWKMNLGPAETEAFFKALPELGLANKRLGPDGLRICLFPPALSLSAAAAATRAIGVAAVELGAQNAHWEPKGAFTGELSVPMIREAGGTWALIGHSERRQHFAETNENIGRRALGVLAQGLNALVCIGETQAERTRGETNLVIAKQLEEALAPTADALSKPTFQTALQARTLVIAYEPVWAIGTGLTATPAQAEEAHRMVRQELARHFGEPAALRAQILYGGSVTPDTIHSLLTCENIDGVLAGGASLKPESFAALVSAGSALTL